MEVWDKALLYKAILEERKASYPSSFSYIFDDVESVVLAPESQEDKLKSRCPTEADYHYFLFLVKKYYIDNGIEGHVVLRCHREPNSQDLLFSSPPPKTDDEVRQAIQKKAKEAPQEDQSAEKPAGKMSFRAPGAYPPIEALWRCEENYPLLRVLVFGELNLVVSENPFTKFPNANAFITRPNIVELEANSTGAEANRQHTQQRDRHNRNARNQSAISLSNVIAERRGHLLAPIPRNTSAALDARASDVRRQLQRHHREDTMGFQRLLKTHGATDDLQAGYGAYSDLAYLNPRTVRAEVRDRLHRRAMNALRHYDEAEENIFREGVEEAVVAASSRPTEQYHMLPSHIPTLPHFVSIVKKDPHVSFLQNVLCSSTATAAVERGAKLHQLVYQLARALHNTALEYHVERNRRIHRQKVNVAAALLDTFVEKELTQFLKSAALREVQQVQVEGQVGERFYSDDVVRAARMLGAPRKFENRMLEASGFTTDARQDDYKRWMEATQKVKNKIKIHHNV
ncbi:hypothetical protein AGDE_05396 [Angomonas deanei]|nr:hypothetical protein AGDE_05396 [Angomonas deanei]|eukprot:EPY38533.1 hypothetical protein AGDE_05396 [Angomonas deanei]